jgi:NAD(P)-dependent dehydrogenase (short-subunit alcohol dehydrogenase family)
MPDQSGRTALVTGASSGLGLHTSLELARKGARVLMAVRSTSRGEQALARVRREVPGATAELLTLDLASLASVRAAADEVAGRAPVLDLLVDNAGVMAVPRRVTEDGFELQLGTNHLGHFALTGLLLPRLLAAGSPRVVVVSSSAHRSGRMRFDDLQGERSYTRWGAYGQSKLANLLFARELQARAGDRLLVAAAHPGYAATNLQSGQESFVLEAFMKVANVVVAQSDAQGAWPSLYAATMPDVRPGDYWGPMLFEVRGAPRRVGRSTAAQDDAAAALLWDASERLTGVTYDL